MQLFWFFHHIRRKPSKSPRSLPLNVSAMTCFAGINQKNCRKGKKKKKMNATHGQNFLCFRTVGKCPETSRTVLITFISATNETLFITMSTSNLKGSKPAMTGWSVFFVFFFHTASFVCSFALLAIRNPHHRDRQEHFHLFLVTTVYSAGVRLRQ